MLPRCQSQRTQANTYKSTIGVILLTDTRPSEPKTLLELKVKKAVAAPAPGAAGSSGAHAAEGRSATTAGAISDNMVEEGEDEASLPGEFEYESETNPDDD